MTRKDYIRLADALGKAIATTARNADKEGLTAIGGCFVALRFVADALASDNPRFDVERFRARVEQAENESAMRAARTDCGPV